MARRASSSIHPLWFAAIIAIIVASTAGGYFLYLQISDPFRTVQALDVKAYLENSNSLRGNRYKVSGTISNSLAWSPADGRLFSIDIENGSEVLPVLIPTEFNHINIQKGQKFRFQVEIDAQGVLKTINLQKA